MARAIGEVIRSPGGRYFLVASNDSTTVVLPCDASGMLLPGGPVAEQFDGTPQDMVRRHARYVTLVKQGTYD